MINLRIEISFFFVFEYENNVFNDDSLNPDKQEC